MNSPGTTQRCPDSSSRWRSLLSASTQPRTQDTASPSNAHTRATEVPRANSNAAFGRRLTKP